MITSCVHTVIILCIHPTTNVVQPFNMLSTWNGYKNIYLVSNGQDFVKTGSIVYPGADPWFQVRGGALKKISPSGGRCENVGVFRVKNHDFTPKNHIFSNCGGRRENIWGISCEKSRFYPKKNHIFSNFRGGARRVRPLLNPPLVSPNKIWKKTQQTLVLIRLYNNEQTIIKWGYRSMKLENWILKSWHSLQLGIFRSWIDK